MLLLRPGRNNINDFRKKLAWKNEKDLKYCAKSTYTIILERHNEQGTDYAARMAELPHYWIHGDIPGGGC